MFSLLTFARSMNTGLACGAERVCRRGHWEISASTSGAAVSALARDPVLPWDIGQRVHTMRTGYWRSGPVGSGSPGKPPAYAGTDFIIVRDGKIAAVYLFFDKLPN